jgi:regulatory factor X 1/2/3
MQEQASWVCQCDDEVVNQLEADFKATLAQQVSSKCIIVLQACKNYFLQMHVVLVVEIDVL